MTNIAHSLCVKLTTDTLCTFCYTIWTPCFSYIYNLLPFCITVLTDLFLISVTDLNVYIVYMLIRCSVSCSEVQILLFILLWVFICWLWWSNIYLSIYLSIIDVFIQSQPLPHSCPLSPPTHSGGDLESKHHFVFGWMLQWLYCLSIISTAQHQYCK